jgi:uncharacterized OB-fold protein
MKPTLPEVIRVSRAHRDKLSALRPGWLCPKCGSAHGPNVQTCPQDRKPPRDIIR